MLDAALGTLGDGTDSNGLAINAQGHIAGTSNIAPTGINGIFDAFLWTASGGMQDLGTLGGQGSHATGINAQDQVTGGAQTAAVTFTQHAFLWTASGGMQDLGTLGGPSGTLSVGQGINAQGQITGESSTADDSTHAFLWTASGGMQDLGTLSGGTFSEAEGINDQGQVIGVSDMADGSSHAFLWTP